MSKDTVTLKFEDIRLNSDGMTNCRSELGDLTGLVDSIKKHGMKQNMCVWQPPGKDYYVLAFGFRRYEALKLIRNEAPDAFAKVPCVLVRGGLVDAQTINLVENLKRKNLNHGDLAGRLGEMYTDRKMKEVEIAKQVGLSQPQVSNLIAVNMKCTPSVLRALKKGFINLATAKKLARLASDKQEEALNSLLADEQAADIDKWLTDQNKGSKKPGIAILRQKLKQIEAHSSEYDGDFRKGVRIGILYGMGLVASDKDLLHPPESMPEQPAAAQGRGKSLKTIQKEKATSKAPAKKVVKKKAVPKK